MKLRVLTCEFCSSPVTFEEGKLVCKYCGAVKEIPKDSSDVQYEQLANAEEYIRISLQKKKQELEDYYAEEERRQIEAEEEADRKERKRQLQMRLKRLRKSIISLVLTVALCFGAVYLVKHFAGKADLQKKQNASATETQTNSVRKNDHVTKDDLLGDAQFMKETEEKALEAAAKVHSSSVIISSKEIWKLSGTPKLLEKYLVTSEKRNYLFFLYQSTLKTKAGDEKTVYNCIAIRDLTVSEDGKISTGKSKLYEEKAGNYDFHFRCSFDIEQLRGELIEDKKNALTTKYFIYEL